MISNQIIWISEPARLSVDSPPGAGSISISFSSIKGHVTIRTQSFATNNKKEGDMGPS